MPRDSTTDRPSSGARRIKLGTAAWAIPSQWAERFAPGGSVLQRYATRFNATEINSSFYKPHRPQTYARWAASVPDDFSFAVKVPKLITHELRLKSCTTALDAFLDQVSMLGGKLGPLLVQLPPSLDFEDASAAAFLTSLRHRFAGSIVLEPRHRGWFTPAVDRLLHAMAVARVAADPSLLPEAGRPGGWRELSYYRLHGSPRLYYSGYSAPFLQALAHTLDAEASRETWCVFDNTAAGAATHDALVLAQGLNPVGPPDSPLVPYPAR